MDRLNTYMLVGLMAAVLCGLTSSDIPQNQHQSGVVQALDQTWFNQTCKNVYCCIDSVMKDLNTNNICLRVEGYGCHFRYQLQKFADVECKMDGPNKDTLMCHRNILQCDEDLGAVIVETQMNDSMHSKKRSRRKRAKRDKDCSDAEDKLSPTLHCERTALGTGSLTCSVKNDTADISECPGVADCQYRKERVSCPEGWAAHRGHCYIYKDEKKSWEEAEEKCQELGDDAHLTTIKRNDENYFVANELQDVSVDADIDAIWWTGLRRLENNENNRDQQVFLWSDNQTFNPQGDFNNWGIDSPETDVNHCVYVRKSKWFFADCSDGFGYTCKMPALLNEPVEDDIEDPKHSYKSLHCYNDITHGTTTTATTMLPPVMTTKTQKQQPLPVVQQVMTTSEFTTEMMTSQKSTTINVMTSVEMSRPETFTTLMMTSSEITSKAMTTLERTSARKVSNEITTKSQAIVQTKVLEREASTKQVTEELKTVTRDLRMSEEAQEEINQEMTKLTTTVGEDTEESSAEAVQSVDNVVDLLASSLTADTLINKSEPIVIQSEAMVIQVYAVTKPTSCEGDSESCPSAAIGGKVQDQTFNVDLPSSLADSGATLAISTVVGLEEKMATTQVNEDQDDNVVTSIASLITSIAISRWDNEPVKFSEENPLVLTFSVIGESKSESQRVCSYWDPDKSGWSNEGCQYNEGKSNNTHTTCECTHLTSFAVLMQVTEVEKTPTPTLDYLTYIGCGFSIFCLMLLILIFLVQKMYRSDRNLIHINLALSLLIAQIIFVVLIDQTQNKNLCKGIAASLHYFLLAVFCWMLNEAIYLLSKTTSARKRWLKMPFFVGIGWGTPAIIVAATLGAGWNTSYNTDDYCWLRAPRAIWAFVGPAILIILINSCMLIKVIHVFLSLKANMNKKKKERLWLSLRALLLTLPLLGITWLIGIFSMDHKGTVVFAYLFVILNSLQGVFIFVLYCIMNDEVKKGLEKRFSVFSTRSSMASTPSSKSSSRDPGIGGKGARSPPGTNA